MIRRAAAMSLLIMLAVLWVLPFAAKAESGVQTVRVGWYETPFNHRDAFGRRTGYAYEYQRKIAAYTGWKYQYVEGNWSELLQMLEDGRIDMLSDVSYTEERAEYMYFTDMPMGSELYYLYIAPDSDGITAGDFASLNGKKIGVTANSVQMGLTREWIGDHGITAELVGLECSEAESLDMLNEGEIDAFVTLDAFSDPDLCMPLWKIGSSDFYFAVSRGRADLLSGLNTAMNQIQEENKYYADELASKYLKDSGSYRYLNNDEIDWLIDHGTIRVGYQDNYMAFCAKDPKTGELTGALKDYLDYATGVLANADVSFEAVAYPTASAAMEALKNGEIDCMFPSNLTDYDGEEAGVVMSPPLMRTAMDAVVREEDAQGFFRNTKIRVAVNRGNPNYEMFLLEHFPNWTPITYESTAACLDQVAAKNADCIIISNYRYNDIARQCEKLSLTTVRTGVDTDYCLAVKEGNTALYAILAKMISHVPDSTVNAALTYYSTLPPETGVIGYIMAHPLTVSLVALSVILLAIVLIMLRRFSTPNRTAK